MSDIASVFTETSAYSLAFVAVVGVVAWVSSNALLPKTAKWQDRFTFIWLAFDAGIHFAFEGSFLSVSMFGRQANTSTGPFAQMWREYALADARWGFADPTIVSMEILTVFGAGPIACYILKQLIQDDPARHYWIVVLSTAELYGGWMTFCPEWVSGSQYLNTSNPFHLWVYLYLMNTIWVFIPLWLMWDSYKHIAGSLRVMQKATRAKKN